jgi:serine/threonine protein kinase
MNTSDGFGAGSAPHQNGEGWEGAPRRPWVGSREGAGDDSGSSSEETSRVEDPQVIAALETYLKSLREGRACSRAEFLAHHAEISAALSGCFSGLEFIEAAAAELSGSPGDPETARAEPALPPQSQLGDYRILREVGRGGMGVVYEAYQISLGRCVALKVLPFAAAVDPKQRQRFQIEAQAAAQLHHPHIVPVYGVGCDHGIHYYAMQFVDGRSLAAIIRELRSSDGTASALAVSSASVGSAETEEASRRSGCTPGGRRSPSVPIRPGAADPLGNARPNADATPDLHHPVGGSSGAPTLSGTVHQDRAFCRNVARLGIEAADALDHAHALGILHRDIKPANLIIDHEGSVWITDFGLARFPGDLSLTGTGDVVGTLRYMSPEQALARRGVVDQRTDVYALGATLYELLALRPAFNGRDHQELLRQIGMDEPIPLRRLNPAVPRDLETIILKAMAKDPYSRYATAQELSEDLKRFRNDDPIQGRRPGPVERTFRWARRRWELVATAAAIFVLSLIVGTFVTWRQARETEEARNRLRHYLIKNFPMLDRSALDQVEKAGAILQGRSDIATRRRAFQVYDQVLENFQEASELPPTDMESRVVIARALCRLAYVHTMLSFQMGTMSRPEPQQMAKAGADFRRSITMLEELLNERLGDPVIRRYLADALGLKGMGCYHRFMHRPEEAERFYNRAIQLRRDLVRGTGLGGVANSRSLTDDTDERDDPLMLVYTVNAVSWMLEAAGRVAEVDRMRIQLEEDVAALAARFSGQEYQTLRRHWADELIKTQGPSNNLSMRRTTLLNARLATILDPENPQARNGLAWALVSIPDDPWFDPKQGLAEARKAVELDPKPGDFWNTLGVAAFRDRDWTTAIDSLERSINITGGNPHDWFFLAMTHWKQGKYKEARRCFDLALAGLKKERRDNLELLRFHAEAAALMGLPGPKSESECEGAKKADGPLKIGRERSTQSHQ